MMSTKGLKGKQTRARILAAAAHEFASRGFHEVTTADILGKVGLTQPAFYVYFPNKQSIFDELILEFRARFRYMIESARLLPEVDPANVLTQIRYSIQMILAFLSQNPDLTKLGFFLDPESEQLKRDLAGLIADNIRSEQALGYLRDHLSPQFVGECLIGIIERSTKSFLLEGTNTPEELAQNIVDMLAPALVKESGQS